MNRIKRLIIDPNKRAYIYCLLMQVFIIVYIPSIGHVGNVLFALLTIYWLTEPHLLSKLKKAFAQRAVIALTAYFGIFIIGMGYTENLAKGFSSLENKLPLLIFPLIFYTIEVGKETVIKIIKTYLVVCFLAGFAGLMNGLRLTLQTGDTSFLYSDNLTLLMKGGQAIYFSVTITVALVFTFYLFVNKQFSKKEIFFYVYFFVPFFILLGFLLAGRLSLGVMVVLILGGLVVLIVQQKKYALGLSLLGMLLLTAVLLVIYFPKTVNRFKSLTSYHFDYQDERNVYHFGEQDFDNRWSGLTIRLAIWSCALDVIQENPLIGVGTGDYNDALHEVYQKKDFRQGMLHKFNPHNQYLHALLSIGIVGLTVFMLSLVVPAIQAFREKNILYLIFLFIIAANMMIVDFLDVNRGVIFFGFFNSLLLFQPKGISKNASDPSPNGEG